MTETPAARVLSALRSRGWTLGVAESLTGGAVCAELVSIPGASDVLLGGVVAYATPVKHTLLGVDDQMLAEHGPVHPGVARQMAQGVRRAMSVGGRAADVGISTTGIAGPDSPDGQPVGTVHVGLATPEGTWTRGLHLDGDRADIRARSVTAVLEALLDVIGE